ncbi:hypothetical protein GCM10007388_10150 [Pseudoduganella plicata]|uniref:Uncharacterized protein n=2 Tax=Pseudoduganella plicata TaxID=321984 RepID=A0AA87Y2M9_9BURK|nr:hypothetical protein GCM10007388_10150 [Pseudoduganella plicata]
MVNTRHISDLIEKGEIGQIREALENSLSPGSQSFEQALYRLVQEGRVTQEEALANADSATNLLWLLNNGPDSRQARQTPTEPAPAAADTTPGASFTEFTLDS